MAALATLAGWLRRPCTFRLQRSYAIKCCACEEKFAFLNRGHVCDFCGYFCHNGANCGRKVWLPRELLRRRICGKCDRYRKVAVLLRTGSDFVLYGRSSCRNVTLALSEAGRELLIVEEGADNHVERVRLDHIDVIRKGFSHGGHMRAVTYHPLKSLSIVVRRRRRHDTMKTYNLRAKNAWLCQMWVDGLQSAKYVHRRLQEQELASEYYQVKGHSHRQQVNDIFQRYLPRMSEMRKFHREGKKRERERREREEAHSSNSSMESSSGTYSNPDTLDLQWESYVDIEVQPGSQEVLSREFIPSPLLGRRRPRAPSSLAFSLSHSTPTTPSQVRSSSPLPIPNDLMSKSTAGLPYSTSPSRLLSLCSCHAYQIITTSFGSRPGSGKNNHTPLPTSQCCTRCQGRCSVVADLDNL